MQVISFDDAREFLKHLRLSEKHWGRRTDCSWIFRGQGDASWPLMPSAWRGNGKSLIDRLVAKIPESDVGDLAKLKSLALYATSGWVNARGEVSLERTSEALMTTAAEVSAVERFVEQSNSVGLRIPSSAYADASARAYLFRISYENHVTAVESGPELLSPQVDDTFALAQHHGVPTRLLDFTRNPLIAAFFAASDGSIGERVAVWAVDMTRLPERVQTLTPRRYENSFLHAQDGLFLLDTKATAAFVREGSWPTLDSIFEAETSGDDLIVKMTLCADQAQRLLRLLWRERVGIPHLMPTYDNIGRSLAHKLDLDETPWE